jgi:hypothetical protein
MAYQKSDGPTAQVFQYAACVRKRKQPATVDRFR